MYPNFFQNAVGYDHFIPYLTFFRTQWVMMTLSNLFQNAVGYDDRTELSKHNSQTDGAKGFGGKFGVDKTNQDKVHNYYSLVGKTRF